MAETATVTAVTTTKPSLPPCFSDADELKKVFSRFDSDSDGRISSSELTAVLQALGSESSPEEIDRMMAELDSDKDGFVNIDEFAAFFAGDDGGAGELKQAFDMYDQDKNGLISAAELTTVLGRLGERCTVQDCTRMIQSVDGDGDGNVSFEEFKRMMTNKKTTS